MDSQYANLAACNTPTQLEPEADETRSFVFIIYPPNDSSNTADSSKVASSTNLNDSSQSTLRVPFRNIVVGLVSHQLLLQTLGLLLLSGSKSEATETEQNLLPIDEANQISGGKRKEGGSAQHSKLPGNFFKNVFWFRN